MHGCRFTQAARLPQLSSVLKEGIADVACDPFRQCIGQGVADE
jgi:hypothetical protein